MLRLQPWIRIAYDVLVEFEQCRSEGKDVAKYEEACRNIAALHEALNDDIEKAAEALAAKMQSVQPSPDFPYDEPSDYESIMAKSASVKPSLPSIPDDSVLRDKIAGAWYGRIAGCLLGKPVEGYRSERLLPLLNGTDNYPMKKYITKAEFTDKLTDELKIDRNACWADNIGGIAPVDDDTNYTVFALKLIENYGCDFKPDDVLEAWLRWIPMLSTCTAERAAYRNAAMGLLAPETAMYKNPYREYIGAQIRGDFFGYINPGNPGRAADMAFRDASISHIKNGIYGEMFVSAMIAASAVTSDIREIIEAGLAYIPEKSRLMRDVRKVVSMYESGASAEDIIAAIHNDYDEHTGFGWCHTNSNAMIVAMALLCGGGDFGKSICLAVQSRFDTDCNGATVGSIVGMINGASAIPAYWIEPFGGNLRTTIEGYNNVTVDMLTDRTLQLMNR